MSEEETDRADRHLHQTALVIAPAVRLAPIFTPTPRAAKRVLEFFTAQINNDHTRRAYLNATRLVGTTVRLH